MHKYWLLLLSFLLHLFLFGQQNPIIEHLITLSKQNPDTALLIINSGQFPNLTLAQRNYIKAYAFSSKGVYDSSIFYCDQSIQNMNTEDSNSYHQVAMLNAENFRILEEYPKTLPLLSASTNYYLRKKDTVNSINCFTRLTEFYRSIEDFDRAYASASKALDILNHYNDDGLKMKAYLYNRIAATLTHQQVLPDSAIKLTKEVISIADQLNLTLLKASSCNELGYLYIDILPDSAEYYMRESIRIYSKLKSYRYACNVKYNLARYIWNSRHNKLEARKLLNEALEISMANDYDIINSQANMLLAEIAHSEGDYKNRAILLDLGWNYKLKSIEKHGLEKIARLQALQDLNNAERLIKEKESEIELFKTEARLEQLEKYLAYSMAGLALLLVIGGGVFIQKYREKTRNLESSTLMLSESNQKLEDSLKQKETLLQEVHHRVKNNLSVLSGLLYLQRKSLENEEAKKALYASEVRIKTIALIHESLYQMQDMVHVNFQEYLLTLCNYIKDSVGNEGSQVSIKISCKELNPSLEEAIPLAMIINELLTNSFKHAFKNQHTPEIGVLFDPIQNKIKVYDNGGGVLEAKENSLGVKLVQIFAEQINAKISTLTENEIFATFITFES